jgi:hypothetical protein
MRIFRIDTLGWGKIKGKKLIMVDNYDPFRKAVGMKAMIGWGEPIEKYLPKKIEIQLDKSKSNGKLENLIGNTVNLLMVDKVMKDIIAGQKQVDSLQNTFNLV